MSTDTTTKKNKPFVWADAAQAEERLLNTFVLYGNSPLYVTVTSSKLVKGELSRSLEGVTKEITDPLFFNFRKLPPLGWVNLLDRPSPKAVFLRRIPTVSRRHGYTTENVVIREIRNNSAERAEESLSSVFTNRGYHDGMDNNFPTALEILEKAPKGTAVAFSRKFAIAKDNAGLSYLYRNLDQVGLISKDALYVFPDTVCFRDEIQESNMFPLEIKEF